MKMAYQRTGGPLVHWNRGRSPGVPIGSQRASDNLSLGSYEPIPKPGGPEILSGTAAIDALESVNDAVHSSIGRKAAACATAFHGYKRNQSVGWALAWAAAGYAAPVLAPVIALAQGFGKAK